jgi:hypothetical protein
MKSLSITYALATGLSDSEAVGRLVADMRRLALGLPFERVGPVVEVARPHPLVCAPVWPGQGCEPAAFGFCKLPPVERWQWSFSCCTQYASRPEHGGLENFLRCHQALVALLDAIRGANLAEVEVGDDGGYWERRDPKRLAEAVRAWNDSGMNLRESERRRLAR